MAAKSGIAVLFLGLALAAPAGAQPAMRAAEPSTTRFKCQDGGDLTATFASRDARLVAIVDSGDGPHTLATVPWTGGPVKLTWSDGVRTLTWSPGVQIMWMDGASHRMCGRSGGHQH